MSTRPDKEQTLVIREWGKSDGYQVSDRGRISAEIQEAFASADTASAFTLRICRHVLHMG